MFAPDGPMNVVMGCLWASCRVTHPDQRTVRGRGAGELQTQRSARVGEPAVVRGAQVQGPGAFGQQVEHVTVGVLDSHRAVFAVACRTEVPVDVGEEVDKIPGAGSGGHDALLVVAEFGPEQVEVALLLLFADLGEQLGLSTARPGCVALGGGSADMMQNDLRCEQTAWAVSQFEREFPAQHSDVDPAIRYRGQAEALPSGAVHPVPEPLIPRHDVESAEQRCSGGRVVVELFGKRGGLVSGLDDDPFVPDPAERLTLDEFAGQSVAQQPWTVFFDRLATADLQFHEFARAHAGDGSQYQHRRGAERSDEGRGLFLVQRRRPWHCALSVVTVNGRSLTTEHRFCSNDF